MKKTTSPERRRVPQPERLEQRLLFAAVVRSGAAEEYDALWNVLRGFESDLGGFAANHNSPGRAGNAALTGFRTLEWGSTFDRVPGDVSGTHYRDVFQTGLVLSTPGTGFQRSPYFAHVNPSYPYAFEQKSTGFPGFLLSPVGSNITDVTFTVPGTSDLVAATNAFGALFLDVDSPTDTTLEFFDRAGASLGKFAAPAFNNGISFLGVRFNAGERAARVRITTGNRALGPDDEGAARDVVVIDDVWFGEPQPIQSHVFRWDGGGPVFSGFSTPQNWAGDVAPAPNAGSVLEFPDVPSGVRSYDYPSGSSFDSIVFTGRGGGVTATSGERVLRLANGIRSVADSGGGAVGGLRTGGPAITLELLGPQAFTALRPGSQLHLAGAIDLQGHDLTLNGAGTIEGDGFLVIDGSDGGSLIKNGSGSVSLGNPRHLDRPMNIRLPDGIVMNEGSLYLGHTLTTDTPVQVRGGQFRSDARLGTLTATGGTVKVGQLGTLDASFGPAATLAVELLPASDPAAASNSRFAVAGAVILGGPALDFTLRSYPGSVPVAPGDRFVIIDNAGSDAVSGTFKDLPEGATFSEDGHILRISYRGGDGNDVVLTAVAAVGAIHYAAPGQPVRVTFSPTPAGVGEDDLTLVNLTTGAVTPASSADFSYDPATGTATWSFSGVAGGRLPDGNYRATLDETTATGAASAVTFEFFVLAGDVNRDRSVNGSDFSILAGNFGRTGQTYGSGDLNGDGRVDGSDFALLAGNFGKTLPPPPPAAGVVAATAAPPAPAPPAASAPPTRRAVRPTPPPKAAEPPRKVAAPTRRVIAKTNRPHRAL
jgi:hypothetical protein